MKLVIYLTLLVCLVSSVSAQKRFSMDDYAKMSAEEKRVLFSGTDNSQLDDPNKFLDLFIQGLEDSDAIVRRRATQKLSLTMIGLQRLKQQNAAIPVKLNRMAEVQKILTAKLTDPDAETRGAAISAIAYSGAPNRETEITLLTQFGRESNEQLKGGIIETMVFAGYESYTFKQAVFSSLLDASDYVRNASSKAAAQIKPTGALPLLVQALERFTSGRHLAVDAVAAYGTEALPYLPNLEKLLADPTIPGDLHNRVSRAIEAIKNPKPQPHTEPKVKAVTLVDTDQLPAPDQKIPPAAVPNTTQPAPEIKTPLETKSAAEPIEEAAQPTQWGIIAALLLALLAIVAVLLKRRA